MTQTSMCLQTGNVNLAEQISEVSQACVTYKFAGDKHQLQPSCLRTYTDLHSCLAVGKIHLLC